MTPTARPNILYVLADDMASWAFRAAGHPAAITPHLDSLARDGAIFDNHFSQSAVCSPSRACLLTGRHCSEVGILDFLCAEDDATGLSTEFPTWAKTLQQSGYQTSLVGKWHLGHADEFHPTRHGFDEFTGFRLGGKSSRDPALELDGEVRTVPGWTTDLLTDATLDFIARRDPARPFCASLHLWAPHANQGVTTPDGDRTWLPLPDEDWAPFRDLDIPIPNPDFPKLDVPRVQRMTREYLASIHGVDRNVGRLLALLDDAGIADNTLVVFSSDNGYNLGHNGIWHKGNGWWILTDNRGDRPNLYDNSLRVPAILRWPGRVCPGTRIDRVVSSLDWFPTFCAAANAPVPVAVRGRDLRPLLDDQASEWDESFLGQYSFWDWNMGGPHLRSWRTRDWKYVRDFRAVVPDELYDLQADPEETTNLLGNGKLDHTAIRDQLNVAMLKRMHEIDDPALNSLG